MQYPVDFPFRRALPAAVGCAFGLVVAVGWLEVADAGTCFHPAGNVSWVLFGDVNGSGSVNVADAVCVLMGTLSDMVGGAAPGCVTSGLGAVGVDLDCDGFVSVSDVLIAVGIALGQPLSAAIDASGDGCPDACDPCVPPSGTSCLIDQQCVPQGGASPAEDCLRCDAALDVWSWSALDDDAPCDGGAGVCESAVCTELPGLVGQGTAGSPYIWSDGSSAASCVEYRQPPAGYAPTPASESAVYSIDPLETGSPIAAYCDMESDGGGWTLWGVIASAPFGYDSVQTGLLGLASPNLTAFGAKPPGTVNRYELSGNTASGAFRANFKESTPSGVLVPSSDSTITKWYVDEFMAGESVGVSHDNARLFLSTTRSGYIGGTLVWLESDNLEPTLGHSIQIGAVSYSSPPSPYQCTLGTSQRLLWVANQSAAGGFNFKNEMNLHRHVGCSNGQTGATATTLRLWYR